MSEVVEIAEIEDAVFRARMAGKSIRAVGKQFGISAREVDRICLERLPEIDDEYRRREVGIELARLDAMLEVFLEKAITESDTYAGALVLKISERRSAYLGLDRPMQVAPISLSVQPAQNSTQKIREIIARIVGDRPPECAEVIPFRSDSEPDEPSPPVA